MNTNPAIAGKILKNFTIIMATALGAVYASDKIISIANKKGMDDVRGQLSSYQATVQPQQDRLDTIFDRTKLMNQAKEKKPWNMTSAEKERHNW